jgi:hypothetical protein
MGGMKDFPINKQTFMITPLKVVFTRYGNEERRRRETRNFFHITPTFPKEHCTSEQVNNILKIFRRGEFKNNPQWQQMMGSSSEIPMGIALPLESNALESMDMLESKAWVKSLLLNPSFQHSIGRGKSLPTLKSVINPDLLVWIANATRKASARSSMFEWATDTRQSMKELIYAMQALKSVFNKGNHTRQLNKMLGSLGGGSLEYEQFTLWYTDNFMDVAGARLINKPVVKLITDRKDTIKINFMNNMETVRKTYLTHKPKHV